MDGGYTPRHSKRDLIIGVLANLVFWPLVATFALAPEPSWSTYFQATLGVGLAISFVFFMGWLAGRIK